MNVGRNFESGKACASVILNKDTSPVGDAVFKTIQISTEMGLSYPAAPTNVISWMFSKPLDFAPGTSNVYANFGYQLLGRVIEKASGKL